MSTAALGCEGLSGMEPAQLGARLKELREGANVSQAELATHLDVSQGTISAWEVGSRSPNFVDVVHIAEYLRVDISEFMKKARPHPLGPGRPRKPPGSADE